MSITGLITTRSQSSLMLGAGAVLSGMAAAALHGNFELLPATLCLLFAIFMQLAGNYYYLYYDESHNSGWSIDMLLHKKIIRAVSRRLSCSVSLVTEWCSLLPRYKLTSLIPIGTLNVLIMGLLSFLIFKITGVPDRSHFTFF